MSGNDDYRRGYYGQSGSTYSDDYNRGALDRQHYNSTIASINKNSEIINNRPNTPLRRGEMSDAIFVILLSFPAYWIAAQVYAATGSFGWFVGVFFGTVWAAWKVILALKLNIFFRSVLKVGIVIGVILLIGSFLTQS